MFWNLFKSAQDMNDELKKKIKDAIKPEQDDINFLQSMQKLEIKEGDIVILRHPCRLSEQVATNLNSQIEELIRSSGFNIKVMVLEEGMDIGILRKEKKNMKKLTKSQIAKIFQVDEEIVDRTISSYGIRIKREREFVDKILKPWLAKIEERIII